MLYLNFSIFQYDKMNKKAFEMAISTLVIIVLGVVLLIGLILAITKGFDFFNTSSKPFLDTTQASSIKQACILACSNEDKITYCCEEYEIDDSEIKCTDTRLEVNCGLNCSGFNCEAETEE